MSSYKSGYFDLEVGPSATDMDKAFASLDSRGSTDTFILRIPIRNEGYILMGLGEDLDHHVHRNGSDVLLLTPHLK